MLDCRDMVVESYRNQMLLLLLHYQEKNSALTSSMRELSNTIGQLQAREQELLTKLKLKVLQRRRNLI